MVVPLEWSSREESPWLIHSLFFFQVAEMLIQSEDLDQVVTFFKSIPDNAQSAIQIRKHFVLHAKGSITGIIISPRA